MSRKGKLTVRQRAKQQSERDKAQPRRAARDADGQVSYTELLASMRIAGTVTEARPGE
jgi:hypothetical protein